MKYLKFAIILFSLGCVIFIIYHVSILLSRKNFEGRLVSEIAKIQDEGGTHLLEMQSVTNFIWDKMYIFVPFTGPDYIEETLGFKWKRAKSIAYRSRDHLNLLVFVRNGQVVEYLEFYGAKGDFSTAIRPEGFTPDEAIFSVDNKLNLTALESD
jgi:hypothetical protein